MKNAIAKALKDLDGLGEKAVRSRILGLKDEADDDAPADGDDGQVPADDGSSPAEDPSAESEIDDETRKKLEELLSQ